MIFVDIPFVCVQACTAEKFQNTCWTPTCFAVADRDALTKALKSNNFDLPYEIHSRSSLRLPCGKAAPLTLFQNIVFAFHAVTCRAGDECGRYLEKKPGFVSVLPSGSIHMTTEEARPKVEAAETAAATCAASSASAPMEAKMVTIQAGEFVQKDILKASNSEDNAAAVSQDENMPPSAAPVSSLYSYYNGASGLKTDVPGPAPASAQPSAQTEEPQPSKPAVKPTSPAPRLDLSRLGHPAPPSPRALNLPSKSGHTG
eukprot:scaffold534731_cov31-Prasinocladus_malaysianus.AAC.1